MDEYPSVSAIWVKFICSLRISCLAASIFIREKILDHAGAAFCLEELLQAGPADQIVRADPVDGDVPVQPAVQIFCKPGKQFVVRIFGGCFIRNKSLVILYRRRDSGFIPKAPEEADQELLQTGPDDLCRPGRRIFTRDQDFLVRIVQPAFQE